MSELGVPSHSQLSGFHKLDLKISTAILSERRVSERDHCLVVSVVENSVAMRSF
jgi:hypothetical protein